MLRSTETMRRRVLRTPRAVPCFAPIPPRPGVWEPFIKLLLIANHASVDEEEIVLLYGVISFGLV